MKSQCNAIHKTIVEQFKHAIVYGQSVKHQPQRVGLSHELADEDISKWSKVACACLMLIVCSHDHKKMKVLNEATSPGSRSPGVKWYYPQTALIAKSMELTTMNPV